MRYTRCETAGLWLLVEAIRGGMMWLFRIQFIIHRPVTLSSYRPRRAVTLFRMSPHAHELLGEAKSYTSLKGQPMSAHPIVSLAVALSVSLRSAVERRNISSRRRSRHGNLHQRRQRTSKPARGTKPTSTANTVVELLNDGYIAHVVLMATPLGFTLRPFVAFD